MKVALLLGDSVGVFDDAARALMLFNPDAVAAVNCIGTRWPGRLDYWMTLHPRPSQPWPGMPEAVRRRQLAKLNRPETWTHKESGGVDRWTQDWAGSSGLFGTKVLVQLKFKVVLAGIPMDPKGAHYYHRAEWGAANSFRKGWTRHRDELKDLVRSMSGWTRTQFGAPTVEWLTASDTSEAGVAVAQSVDERMGPK